MNRLYHQSDLLEPGEISDFLENIMQSSTQYSIVGIAPDLTIQLWNEGARRLYGYEPDEVIGEADISILHVPEDLPERLSAIIEITRRTGQWLGQLQRVRKDGERFLASVALNVRRDRSGRHLGFLLISRDISEERKFQNLLESAPDATVVVNSVGVMVLVNAQAERLFGYIRDEMITRSLAMVMPNLLIRQEFEGREATGQRKDGTEFPAEISLSPLETAEGSLTSISIRDITERKRFELELREKNAELAAANRTKDTFLASMSHELRTPLNSIIGFTGTLLMRLPGQLNKEQERQLRMVQNSGRHLLSLINDLLDLTKIESGKVDLHPVPVNCGAIVEEVALLQKPSADAKGLTVDVAVPDMPVIAQTDARAVKQILLNLAGNAVKFTEKGVVRLELRHFEDRLEFQVTDTGCGIAEKDKGRLFQAFTQVGAPREGTGLGLLLSRRLAELLGGSIEMESREGEGSTFRLTLPNL